MIRASVDSDVNASMVNPFRQVTNVSQSVAKMQREGLALNRRPEIAAALIQSSGKNSLHQESLGIFEKP